MQSQQLLIPSEIYSIDTCVLIDLWSSREQYFFSKERVPQLWDHIQKLVDNKRIIASREVLDEIKADASPDLVSWAKEHSQIFSLSQDQFTNAQDIINEVYDKYPGGYKPEYNNGADPFVVALAAEKHAVVFTNEKVQHDHKLTDPNCPSNPSIPTVCKLYNIECVNVEKFIDREKLSISLNQNGH